VTDGELIPVFSHNKQQWGESNPDGLTWYFSTTRSDFTFRLKVFGAWCDTGKQFNHINAEKMKTYSISATLYEDHASYSIDGEKYADCYYKKGSVPDHGYFGFATYSWDEEKIVSNFKVEQLGTQHLLQKESSVNTVSDKLRVLADNLDKDLMNLAMSI
jgi:hypothetical protein